MKIGDDEELMDLCAESGCKGLLIGFESVEQDALVEINKGFNVVEKYRNLCNRLHERGIAINGTFIFGMDSDTKDTFRRTVDFVQENAIELPRYAIYTPFQELVHLENSNHKTEF